LVPRKSRSVVADLRNYFFHKPEVDTLIDFSSLAQREQYGKRILQRLGVDVDHYSVLNVHQIGIGVPVRFVHEELMHWNQDSPFWPNHIATIQSIDGSYEHISILLLGRATAKLRQWLRRIAPDFGLLFNMNALKIQHEPHPSDFDNARFALYECSGGYPIGVYFQYVRSPIESQGEVERAQLIFAVSFDFYGKQKWPSFVAKLWKAIHNRVTANVLNRFKRLCEAEFRDYTSDTGIARLVAEKLRQG
jgi:hypothetical protein